MSDLPKSYWKISYNTEFAFNNGHPNIDNYGDFSAQGDFNSLISTRSISKSDFKNSSIRPKVRTSNPARGISLGNTKQILRFFKCDAFELMIEYFIEKRYYQ